ncbi:MAG: transmembrane Mn(2+) transporter [Planctomycetes bacterium]|nr:transmembrane Mn(2+) transporter [Planctomycetota bacterium]
MLQRLGPGLIIAGAIVGSGELVATTKVGAEAGFWLLWLIVIGCLIKVFTQVEFGRMAITEGRTTLSALDVVPGPRLRANWIVWFWLFMTLVGIAQLGGIVGGVGQALAISTPITHDGRAFNEVQDEWVERRVARRVADHRGQLVTPADVAREESAARAAADAPVPFDPVLWAALISLPTSLMLVIGRYRLVQIVSTALVASFTLFTVVTLILLQMRPEWAIRAKDVGDGLSFRMPPPREGLDPLPTALAAFGIIGVGAAELISYPYWCLEKGYARWSGPGADSPDWVERARGWMRVLRYDAFLSMVVYTVGTVAFFLLGAAVLGRTGLVPENKSMIRTLAAMYEPVFGEHAGTLFLGGALAVLYSTYFVASASYARVGADAIGIFGKRPLTPERRRFWERVLCAAIPVASVFIFGFVRAPTGLILAAGVSQALMLPVLGFAALWFRYRRGHPEIRPGRLWDAMLWLSGLGLLIAGGWAAWTRF